MRKPARSPQPASSLPCILIARRASRSRSRTRSAPMTAGSWLPPDDALKIAGSCVRRFTYAAAGIGHARPQSQERAMSICHAHRAAAAFFAALLWAMPAHAEPPRLAAETVLVMPRVDRFVAADAFKANAMIGGRAVW